MRRKRKNPTNRQVEMMFKTALFGRPQHVYDFIAMSQVLVKHYGLSKKAIKKARISYDETTEQTTIFIPRFVLNGSFAADEREANEIILCECKSKWWNTVIVMEMFNHSSDYQRALNARGIDQIVRYEVFA